MVTVRKFVVAKEIVGELKEDDLILEEEELPSLENEEYLVEASFLSVDPYMRARASAYKIGQLMIGVQVAKVIASKNSNYPVGTRIVANLGWCTHTIIKPGDNFQQFYILPDIGNLPESVALGVLGRPGNSAYFGFLDFCQPKQGETVIISAAAGAVGSHVGQIAKIKGCTVIGLTSTEQKSTWLKSLGFDHVINYKNTSNLAEILRQLAPQGIDCYFDNVGGEISSTIINIMNDFGRISVCGSISNYNNKETAKAATIQFALWKKHLRMRGFLVDEFKGRWFEGISQNLQWIQEGKVKYRETITDGFENATRALIDCMEGKNIGKSVVRIKGTNVESGSLNFTDAFETFKKLSKR